MAMAVSDLGCRRTASYFFLFLCRLVVKVRSNFLSYLVTLKVIGSICLYKKQKNGSEEKTTIKGLVSVLFFTSKDPITLSVICIK